MNAHDNHDHSIVVDLQALDALQHERVHPVDVIDDYVKKLIRMRAIDTLVSLLPLPHVH